MCAVTLLPFDTRGQRDMTDEVMDAVDARIQEVDPGGLSLEAAEWRVRQFLTEYTQGWLAIGPLFEKRDLNMFSRWREVLAQITQHQFTSSTSVNFGSSYMNPPAYGLEAEQIARSAFRGSKAYVWTEPRGDRGRRNKYTLEPDGETWKIATVGKVVPGGSLPSIAKAKVKELVLDTSPDAPLASLPDAQTRLDSQRIFEDRQVTRPQDGETTSTVVTPMGALVTSSGVLSIGDYGDDNKDALPLARTVEPGTHPMERVVAFGRNAAVRVRFSDEPVRSWFPASLPAGGHVIGVDARCVYIADFVAYAAMTFPAKEKVYDKFLTLEEPAAGAFAMGKSNKGVALASGFGDGSYPTLWGLDAQGNTAQLVIDFMVLVAQAEDGTLTHF